MTNTCKCGNMLDTGRVSTEYSNFKISDDIAGHFLLQRGTCLLVEDHEQEPPRMWWEDQDADSN